MMLVEAATTGFVPVGLGRGNRSTLRGLAGAKGSGWQREAEVAERPLLEPP